MESQPSVTITRADADDARLLALVGRETFLSAFTGRIEHDDLIAFADQRYGDRQQRAELEDSRSSFLIGRVGEQVIGYGKLAESAAPACVSAKHPVELERLYLYANWHGRGVGKLFLDRCISEATCRSHDVIWLDVWDRNAQAASFYKKSGFVVVGERPYIVGSIEQRHLLMSRAL